MAGALELGDRLKCAVGIDDCQESAGRRNFEVDMSLSRCLADLEQSNFGPVRTWLAVKHSMQHDEGSQSLKLVEMAVSQADHEDCPQARVSHETVAGLVMVRMFSWHAKTEAKLLDLMINVSLDALMNWAAVEKHHFRSSRCLGGQSNWRWVEEISSTRLLAPWLTTEFDGSLGRERG